MQPVVSVLRVCLSFLSALCFFSVSIPAQTEPELTSIQTFLSEARTWGESRQVRLRGTVTHVISDRTYFIQESSFGVYVFQKPDPPFHPGELVEVTGYPSLGGLSATLQNCSARLIGLGRIPEPERITEAQLLQPEYAMRLVRIQGRIGEHELMKGRLLLVRPPESTQSFQVNLEAIENLEVFARPEPGSLIEVVGVLVQRAGPDHRPAHATILLPAISHLTVIAGPPFWNSRRVGRTVAGMGVALVVILGWVMLLRKEVKRQTRLVEERFKREAALQDRFAKVFRAGPDALLITRASDDTIIEANPAFGALAGMPVSEIVGRKEGDIGIWADLEGRSKALADLGKAGSLADFECAFKSRTGKVVACHYSAERIELDGERCRLGIWRDMSEQKRAEEERRQLQNQLARAQRMESLGTLAGGVAHDFNNLLAAILGNTELAQESTHSPGEMSRCLEEIRTASLRGRNLVQRILSFSRPQQQARVPTQLGPVVSEAIGLLRVALPAGVEIDAAIDANCPPVLADATQIHQIIMNLGTNAWQAMEQKPGRIKISLRPLSMDAAMCARFTDLKPGLYACLSVDDQGVGMTAEVRERIFEPFFTTKGPGKGTGLGLAAVHGFIKSHGGAIEVVSEPGRGSTFFVFLPATHLPAEGSASNHARRGAVEGQPLKILLVDDEEPVLSAVQRMLERFGHSVTAFSKPADATALFKENPYGFDLILTDLNMPGMTGMEVAKQMRNLRADIPIILGSGNISVELVTRALRAGVSRILHKPITMEELSKVIRGEPAVEIAAEI